MMKDEDKQTEEIKNGIFETFHENGQLASRENYKDGVLQDENDEQTDDTATETTDAAPKGKMVKLQKVKLSETQLTLWEVEFTVDKSYDKKNIIDRKGDYAAVVALIA